MSTAALFVEAVDTLITLIRAAFGWLVFLATVAAILLLAAIACGAWAVDTALDRLCWGRRAVEVDEAPELEDATRAVRGRAGRRTPAWAHTDHHDDLEEAA